ncbi:MAG TPA: DoxX family protein [Candidatus Binataceae bacterium]|jgi:putative oxidoreductase|nr:DoxX family protein [Candidatus Binataceae bacterium]
MDSMRNVGALIGRLLLAYIFVDSGIGKLMNPGGTMKYMEAGGLHHAVPLLFVIAVIIELIGGLMVAVGWKTELAAFIIFLFCIPVTIIFHVIPGQTLQWHKNLAFMGGLLMVAVYGGGEISIDGGRKAAGAVAPRAAA